MPTHIVVDRDSLAPGQDPPGFSESEDYVEMNGGDVLGGLGVGWGGVGRVCCMLPLGGEWWRAGAGCVLCGAVWLCGT